MVSSKTIGVKMFVPADKHTDETLEKSLVMAGHAVSRVLAQRQGMSVLTPTDERPEAIVSYVDVEDGENEGEDGIWYELFYEGGEK